MQPPLAALLACAVTVFGQRSEPTAPSSAAALNPLVVDAVAIDTSGRPVTDLTAADFEVVQGGRARAISNFTWFDTRLHTAVSGQLPALDLQPDEIRRNLVLVVDDLGLSLAGVQAVRATLQSFIAGTMSSGDRVALLRGSGGDGVLRQLTGDSRILTQAIEDLRYLGGGTSAASAFHSSWLTLEHALSGLREIAGRKVVVFFSENPGMPDPAENLKETLREAVAAGAAVYAVHPLAQARPVPGAPPCPLEQIAHDTGGVFGTDLAGVLQAELGYYAIGFQLDDDVGGPSPRWSTATPAVVKVRRPGIVLRARAGYLHQPPRVDFPVPVAHAVLLRDALISPFSGAGIRARLTAIFNESIVGGGAAVEGILHIDPTDFSFIHDLAGMYQGAVLLHVAAVPADGGTASVLDEGKALILRPADYQRGLQIGVDLHFQLKLPRPGDWQIRAVVADSASDRIGSATQFLDIPDVRNGALALSSLVLGVSRPADRPDDPNGQPGVRIFHPGQACSFVYSVFNPLAGPDKQSILEVRTRIFAEGRVLHEGVAARLNFPQMPAGARRLVKGQISLDPTMAPGDFILQVTVRDLAAPPGETRTASQFTDFQVRK